MTAAAQNRYAERQPSEYVPYNGASGFTYFSHTFQMYSALGTGIRPLVQGAGASNGRFIGVNDNNVDLSAGLGASQDTLNVWKTGEFTFDANGTGTSAHIGQIAYGIDDKTAGVSAAAPALPVGEIVGIPTTSTYRIRIDNAINAQPNDRGVSWAATQN